MTKINDLINEKCPNGVEYKTIESIFTLLTGMTGVSKKWTENGNCRFIDYMNVYRNRKVNVNLLPYATVKNNKQTTLEKGDILLTSASEVAEECAISSVIEDPIENGIFMDDHLFGLRLKDEYKQTINTTFINYYFESKQFRENLYTTVRGVTRFYISNKNFMKLEIPIPPIDIQTEIVRILDKFLKLEIELNVELEERKKQYEFWREKLLRTNYDIKKLKDVANIYDSLHATPKYVDVGYPMIRVADVKFGYVNIENALKVDKKTFEKFIGKYKPKKEDIIISRVGSYGNLCVVGDEDICLGQNTSIINPKINKKYLYYFLSGTHVQEWIKSNVKGAGYKSLSLANINEIPVTVPPLEEQEKIVNILDKFEKLINDKSEGILAEIELRKKQYEYYRNKLLSFKEVID